jgi:hypothetical protein
MEPGLQTDFPKTAALVKARTGNEKQRTEHLKETLEGKPEPIHDFKILTIHWCYVSSC